MRAKPQNSPLCNGRVLLTDRSAPVNWVSSPRLYDRVRETAGPGGWDGGRPGVIAAGILEFDVVASLLHAYLSMLRWSLYMKMDFKWIIITKRCTA